MGVWLSEVDVVEGKYTCKFNGTLWLVCKIGSNLLYAQANNNTLDLCRVVQGNIESILSVNPDADTFDVQYDDGELDKGLRRSCVKAYKPLEVGEIAAVRSKDMMFYEGRVCCRGTCGWDS
jgi:hypothetical protein